MRMRVGLGDLLCSMPALRAIRRARPDLRVALVTWSEMAPVVARMGGDVDELLPFAGYPGIPDRPVDAVGLRSFLRSARQRRFDLALQMYFDHPAADAVTAQVGARITGGFASRGVPGLDPATHMPYPHHLHEVWRHLRLVEQLGVELSSDAGRISFPIWPKDESALHRTLTSARAGAGPWAVVHPGATATSRRWSAARFAAVADRLAGAGLQVIVTGAEHERSLTRAVTQAMRAPSVDLTGATSLGSLAALLRRSAVLVSNDTGVAHLAVAVGTPAVTVFLAGDPRRWAHAGSLQRPVFATAVCNPCDHLDCPIDHRCASAVTVDMVASAARALLLERRDRAARVA